jgi:hypothetical protein
VRGPWHALIVGRNFGRGCEPQNPTRNNDVWGTLRLRPAPVSWPREAVLLCAVSGRRRRLRVPLVHFERTPLGAFTRRGHGLAWQARLLLAAPCCYAKAPIWRLAFPGTAAYCSRVAGRGRRASAMDGRAGQTDKAKNATCHCDVWSTLKLLCCFAALLLCCRVLVLRPFSAYGSDSPGSVTASSRALAWSRWLRSRTDVAGALLVALASDCASVAGDPRESGCASLLRSRLEAGATKWGGFGVVLFWVSFLLCFALLGLLVLLGSVTGGPALALLRRGRRHRTSRTEEGSAKAQRDPSSLLAPQDDSIVGQDDRVGSLRSVAAF